MSISFCRIVWTLMCVIANKVLEHRRELCLAKRSVSDAVVVNSQKLHIHTNHFPKWQS